MQQQFSIFFILSVNLWY